MDFIGLARAVRSRSGLQGTGPSSVTTASGVELLLVQTIQDAWLDIQNYEVPVSRICWSWMRASASFFTVSGTNTYTLSDIFNPNYRFKKWMNDTMYVTVDGQRSIVRYMDYDKFNYKYANDTSTGKIQNFTIRPSDSAIMFNNPDSNYLIEIDYQKSPQELVNDTDTPELPTHYHILIVYMALEKFAATYSGEASQFQQYSFESVKLLGSLLRSQMPKAKVKPRSLA